MAQMALSYAGQYIGSQIGGTVLGVSAAQIGSSIGAIAGSVADNYIFGQNTKANKLSDLNVQASTEGAAIPRIDGTIRVAGQVIWATKFKRTKKTTSGKGTGSTSTTYKYKISFAVALCEGEVETLGRIWADGTLLDTSDYTIRFYNGTEDQEVDSLIAETEGDDNSPAYKGICYVVFEEMNVTKFGARIPQLQFEITRPLTAQRDENALENIITGVNLIPGAGEFVYATTLVIAEDDAVTEVQNGANAESSTYADALASLDALEDVAPNLKTVQLVVGWFGSDLRAGQCTIKPKVEEHGKSTYGEYTDDDDETQETDYSWSVDDLSRSEAEVVSYVDSYPAYGGTPADRSVKQIIKAIKKRGWNVVFYPFIFMDITEDNTLPTPYADDADTSATDETDSTLTQPAFPWRGRITCCPAVGYDDTADQTSAADDQIEAFFTGTWGYNRMVKHYAKLCKAAGGVDGFIIGSELVGLTQVRNADGDYPAVTYLKSLAATVKDTLDDDDCEVGYAADWSEWNNYQHDDGLVDFNLDPLWSDDNIDFIGIDNYMPLSDWRDGTDHLDYDADDGPTTIYDVDYLQSNIKGGEDYDWYYASDDDRDSQTRTTITDDTVGKPWVWRAKDLWNWWGNSHYNRSVKDVEDSTATGWVPCSKPIRFTELGCPAVEKGANEPNVFYDPKSSESALPYYSTGDRDDLIQRYFLQAHYQFWTDDDNNPTDSTTKVQMVDTDYLCAWCWDARPYPYFPGRTDLWSDCDNYSLGHWLNGRLGAVLLDDLVEEICEESDFTDYDTDNLTGLVTGYARTTITSARDELQSLAQAFFFDGVESQGKIKFTMRGQEAAATYSEDDLVLGDNPASRFSLTRGQDAELPIAYAVSYINAGNGYETGTYRAKRLVGNSNRVVNLSLPMVMDRSQAGTVGDKAIQEYWVSRESASFALPPSAIALDPADEITLTAGGRTRSLRLQQVTDSESRAMTAIASDSSIYGSCPSVAEETVKTSTTSNTGRVTLALMDIPMLTADDTAYAPHLAAYADPWNAAYLYRSTDGESYTLDSTISETSDIGETLYDFYDGPTSRWDNVNALYVKLYSGTLASASETDVLNGANALAIQTSTGWEIVQFKTATLTDTQEWKLSGLLRGQLGTEVYMDSPLTAGAQVVVLDSDTITQADITLAQYNTTFTWKWGPADKDISTASYQSASESLTGAGLIPYAPCHVRHTWNDGAITISWVRRDRSPDADSWDQSEIPQSEDAEEYALEILDSSGAVLRTVTGLTVSSWLYTAAYQKTDFGAVLTQGDSLNVTVYQISATIGRGHGKSATLYL